MATSGLGAFIEIESSSKVVSPPPAVHKSQQGVSQRPSSYELKELHPHDSSAQSAPERVTQTPPSSSSPTPSVLENRLSTFEADEHEAAEWAPDRTSTSSKTKWRLLSCCIISLGNGMNDSAPGALIPYMEKHYDIGYAVVSLIFVTNALGFISAAPFAHAIEHRLGRWKSYAFAMSLLAVSYAIIICQPPFPVVVVMFFFLGFGIALALALSNVYCANLANSTTALSFFSGAYGIGGTVAPLFATAMVSSGIRWSFFYSVSLAVSLANLAYSSWAFFDYEKDAPSEPQRTLQRTASRPSGQGGSISRAQLLKNTIRNRTILLGALFIFAYQGAEVSTSGWVVSFLISYRHGDPLRVGYVSAGFWAGITVGRFLLTHSAAKIGHKVAVVAMVAGAVAFQLMTWLIPNVIGEAVSVAILGLLLGPVYPSATAVFTKLLPKSMHISSLSFISALGSSGGAVSPFFTGLLAQNVGTMVLHPICVGLYGVMATSWLLLPKISKRSE